MECKLILERPYILPSLYQLLYFKKVGWTIFRNNSDLANFLVKVELTFSIKASLQVLMRQFFPLAGFPGPADLRWSSDNAVVGWDLPNFLWPVGTAKGFSTGWTTQRSCQEGWIICLVSTSSVQLGSIWLWYVFWLASPLILHLAKEWWNLDLVFSLKDIYWINSNFRHNIETVRKNLILLLIMFILLNKLFKLFNCCY